MSPLLFNTTAISKATTEKKKHRLHGIIGQIQIKKNGLIPTNPVLPVAFNATHTGKPTFQCEVCKHSFAQKSNLMRHERTHTGEKPFKCKVCDRNFSQKGNLKEHELIHTGEKPFQCRVCKHSSAQKRNLMRHERIHTGEKPFSCTICDYKASRRGNVTSHMKRRHTIVKS